MGLSIGVKEWAAVVEALGTGKQTLMIRSYACRYPQFLLYPTFNYYTSNVRTETLDEKFKPDFRELAHKAGEKVANRAKDHFVDIDYWAELDEIVPLEIDSPLSSLNSQFIWSLDHVEQYRASTSRSLCVWLIRVYKFPKTQVLGRLGSGVPNYYRHPSELSTNGSEPVLSEDQYAQKKKNLLSKLAPLAVR